MASNVDYKATYFEYKALTRIHGKPSFETLKILHNQLKANAGAVPSTLGGGANGHLGLVVDPQQYALISNIPYLRPQQPPPFILPPNTRPEIAMILRDNHADNIRTYREFIGVENALRQQIVEAIENRWLQSLRNNITNAISMPVYEIIAFLFRMHGKITPTELQQRLTTVSAMVYDPVQPIDDVFDAIQEIADLAQVAGVPFTNLQMVNMAYVIINNTRKFGKYIVEWNHLPPMQRTWMRFKDFFRTAYAELAETTDLTTQDTPFQANFIQEIVQGLREEMRELSVNSSYVNHTEVQNNNDTDEVSTLHDEIQSLRTTVSQLQNQINTQAQQVNYSPPPSYITANPGIFNTTTRAPSPTATVTTETSSITRQSRNTGTPTVPTQRVWHYCWTHGVCGHSSDKCFRKAQGHVDTATFDNICKGSVKGLKKYNRARNK